MSLNNFLADDISPSITTLFKLPTSPLETKTTFPHLSQLTIRHPLHLREATTLDQLRRIGDKAVFLRKLSHFLHHGASRTWAQVENRCCLAVLLLLFLLMRFSYSLVLPLYVSLSLTFVSVRCLRAL